MPQAPGTEALTGRQQAVLRAMVMAYVGEAAPVASATLTHVLPTKLSSASVRTTLAELTDLGLVEQPHTSSGRIPTDEGLRHFIDELLDQQDVADYDRRAITFGVDEAEGAAMAHVVAELLSERTRLLGFAISPRIERVVLRHLSLVRLTSDRVLAVLVSSTGDAYRRVLQDSELGQRELERAAALLNRRLVGRSLSQVREALQREARALRKEADRLLSRALDLGSKALAADEEGPDLVIATRLALLDQPEFHDPRRVRDLFEALETRELLLEVLDHMVEADEGVRVVLGGEVSAPALHDCALVATRYGGEDAPLGTLGVIGPSRMDYGRVIALVSYCSRVVTEKLST